MARERKFSTEILFQTGKELLLQHGYEGFHFGLLADRLEVARGTIYKYYDNKEEFITDYMIHEMQAFLEDLKGIRELAGFETQLDELLRIMDHHRSIHQILGMNQQISPDVNEKVRHHKSRLEQMHLDMYGELRQFVESGRTEGLLNPKLPDPLILGMIFQTINIPNHTQLPRELWLSSIRLMICHGIYNNS